MKHNLKVSREGNKVTGGTLVPLSPAWGTDRASYSKIAMQYILFL